MEFFDLEGNGGLSWFPMLRFGYIVCIYKLFQYEMARQHGPWQPSAMALINLKQLQLFESGKYMGINVFIKTHLGSCCCPQNLF